MPDRPRADNSQGEPITDDLSPGQTLIVGSSRVPAKADRSGPVPYDPSAKEKRDQERAERRKREAKARDEEREALREWLELKRFIAKETGVDFLVSPVFTGYEIPTQEGVERIAENAASYGRMPFDIAQRESFIYLGQLAKMQDIDPNAAIVEMPDGKRMTGIRASILQKKAREFLASRKKSQ